MCECFLHYLFFQISDLTHLSVTCINIITSYILVGECENSLLKLIFSIVLVCFSVSFLEIIMPACPIVVDYYTTSRLLTA